MYDILITVLHYQVIYSLWHFMTVQLCQQTLSRTSYHGWENTFPSLLLWGGGEGTEANQSLLAPCAWAVKEDTHCQRFSLCEQHMFPLPGIFLVILSFRFSWRQIYPQANESWHFLCQLLHRLHWFNAVQVSTNRKASLLEPFFRATSLSRFKELPALWSTVTFGLSSLGPSTEFRLPLGLSEQLQRKEVSCFRRRVWIWWPLSSL